MMREKMLRQIRRRSLKSGCGFCFCYNELNDLPRGCKLAFSISLKEYFLYPEPPRKESEIEHSSIQSQSEVEVEVNREKEK